MIYAAERERAPPRHHVGSHKTSLPPVLTEQSCDDRDHITELNSARPKQPFYFLKPTSSILLPGAGPVIRPRGVDLHYEVELALVIGKRLRDFNAKNEQEALDAIESTSSPLPSKPVSQAPMRLRWCNVQIYTLYIYIYRTFLVPTVLT